MTAVSSKLVYTYRHDHTPAVYVREAWFGEPYTEVASIWAWDRVLGRWVAEQEGFAYRDEHKCGPHDAPPEAQQSEHWAALVARLSNESTFQAG